MFESLKKAVIQGIRVQRGNITDAAMGARSATVTKVVPDKEMSVVHFQVDGTGQKASMIVSNAFAPLVGDKISYNQYLK